MIDRFRLALSGRTKQHITDSTRIPAAVLLPLYYKRGEYYVLLTRRTETVETHKGQISFPGGAYEKKDVTLANTALRETEEEIGLKPESIELLGELDDVPTTASNYVISPFIGDIPYPYPFRLDPIECASLIEVPIAILLDKKTWRQETEIVNGQPVATSAYVCQGNVIWGATARILSQFLQLWQDAMEYPEDRI